MLNNIFVSDLRKLARQLENEIDAKLVNFSKLGSGPTPFNSTKQNGLVNNKLKHNFHQMNFSSQSYRESAHLLSDSSFAFESVSSEIQILLNKVYGKYFFLNCTFSNL